jgi:hypothetical protein
MPHPNVRVVRSRIAGYGVVATRDLAEGELIAEMEGVVWHAEEKLDDTYSLLLAPGVFLDLVDQTRWINHSCDPNAHVQMGLGDGAGEGEGRAAWARVVAARAIRKGEEITFDYAFAPAVAEPCHCGADACRGWIVDEDELHRMPRPGKRRVRAAG